MNLCAVQLTDELHVRPFRIKSRSRAGGPTDLDREPSQRIFEGRLQLVIRQSEVGGYRSGQPLRGGSGVGIELGSIERIGQQSRITPQLLAVCSPDEADLPARHRLTGIPLALAALHQAAFGIAIRQRSSQPIGQLSFFRPVRGDRPLG